MAKFIHSDLIIGNHFNLSTHSTLHTHSTRFRNNLIAPQVRTNVALKFVTSAGISLYNSLPDHLKSCGDLNKFKICYKRCLLDLYS